MFNVLEVETTRGMIARFDAIEHSPPVPWRRGGEAALLGQHLIAHKLTKRFDGLKRPTFRSASAPEGAPMDFSAKLENLQAKVNETVETARAAAAENRDQLKQRVDKAEDNAKQAMQDAKQQAEQTADRAKSKWAQMKADAAAQREDMKAKINKRADQLDAKAAAADADWAEQDAADAIDYAVYVISDAQLAVLDALDARAYADERAKIAGT
jgi:hypothetical protein